MSDELKSVKKCHIDDHGSETFFELMMFQVEKANIQIYFSFLVFFIKI